MSIHYPELPTTKQTPSAHLSQVAATDPAIIAASSADWRPGSREQKRKRTQSLSAFATTQKERLLQLRTALTQSMDLVANDACPEPGDASALATHPGDAGTDASDRDLALRLLYLEQNTLVEIDEALRRIEEGTYGICEVSGERIPIRRLEALPFARLTVECQTQIEKQRASSVNA